MFLICPFLSSLSLFLSFSLSFVKTYAINLRRLILIKFKSFFHRALEYNNYGVLGDGVSGSNTTDNYVDKSHGTRAGVTFRNKKKIMSKIYEIKFYNIKKQAEVIMYI